MLKIPLTPPFSKGEAGVVIVFVTFSVEHFASETEVRQEIEQAGF